MAKRLIQISLALFLISGLANAQMLAFWNGTTTDIPTGWSCISCDSEVDIAHQRFPMCNLSNYGNTGGASALQGTHTHSFTLLSVSPPSNYASFTAGLPNGANVAGHLHTHTTLTINTNIASNSLPPYKDFFLIQYNLGIPAVIPQGVILFYNSTSIPSGFTRLGGMDWLFPRGSNSNSTTGGGLNHTHIGVASTISVVSGNGVGTSAPVTKTATTTTHSHVLQTLNFTLADNTPSYYDLVMIQANSNQPIPNGTIAMMNGSLSNANWTKDANCNDMLLRANNSYGTKGGAANHSHLNVSVGSLLQSATVLRTTGAVTSFATSHAHNVVNVSANNASNFPAFITVLLYVFQSNVTNPPDIQPPAIFIDQPRNNLLYCSSSVAFNHTETDGTGLSVCWYNLNNGANTTITCNLNTTIGSLTTGNYTLNLFANDTLNQVNTSNVNFSIDISLPSTIINSPLNQTYNQSNTTVLLNLTTSADTNVILYSLNGSANLTYTTPLLLLAGNGSNLIEVFTNDSCNYLTYNNRYFTINQTLNVTPTPTPPGNNTKLFKESWYKVIDDEDCRYPMPLSWLLCRIS